MNDRGPATRRGLFSLPAGADPLRLPTLAAMSLAGLEGRTYGPITARIGSEKVAEYVTTTGDDPERWSQAAPPSYAGALLFLAAPAFIHSPEVGEHTNVLVHSDQLFRWHGPLAIGAAIEVTGAVARVRERGELSFVTFEVTVDEVGGRRLLDSTSTFLMGAGAAASPGPDNGEPPVRRGSVNTTMAMVAAAPGVEMGPYQLGVSRLDLVRYAAASGDFNPIHFDHEAARSAGLDGIVVHGLLMAAWLARVAATTAGGEAPLAEMKLRFRQALRPGVTATAQGRIRDVDATGGATMAMALQADGTDLVTATARTREP